MFESLNVRERGPDASIGVMKKVQTDKTITPRVRKKDATASAMYRLHGRVKNVEAYISHFKGGQ